MKTTKNIARLAVTAGLTVALSFGGVIAPATMAFAEVGSTVTFEDAYSSTTTYKGIQIFTANVSGSTATNIQWAGSGTQQTTIQEAVVGAINEWSKDHNLGGYTSENAQDAAEWLNTNAHVNGKDSRIANDNVLNIVAKKLNESNLTGERPRKVAAGLPDSVLATGCFSPMVSISPLTDRQSSNRSMSSPRLSLSS